MAKSKSDSAAASRRKDSKVSRKLSKDGTKSKRRSSAAPNRNDSARPHRSSAPEPETNSLANVAIPHRPSTGVSHGRPPKAQQPVALTIPPISAASPAAASSRLLAVTTPVSGSAGSDSPTGVSRRRGPSAALVLSPADLIQKGGMLTAAHARADSNDSSTAYATSPGACSSSGSAGAGGAVSATDWFTAHALAGTPRSFSGSLPATSPGKHSRRSARRERIALEHASATRIQRWFRRSRSGRMLRLEDFNRLPSLVAARLATEQELEEAREQWAWQVLRRFANTAAQRLRGRTHALAAGQQQQVGAVVLAAVMAQLSAREAGARRIMRARHAVAVIERAWSRSPLAAKAANTISARHARLLVLEHELIARRDLYRQHALALNTLHQQCYNPEHVRHFHRELHERRRAAERAATLLLPPPPSGSTTTATSTATNTVTSASLVVRGSDKRSGGPSATVTGGGSALDASFLNRTVATDRPSSSTVSVSRRLSPPPESPEPIDFADEERALKWIRTLHLYSRAERQLLAEQGLIPTSVVNAPPPSSSTARPTLVERALPSQTLLHSSDAPPAPTGVDTGAEAGSGHGAAALGSAGIAVVNSATEDERPPLFAAEQGADEPPVAEEFDAIFRSLYGPELYDLLLGLEERVRREYLGAETTLEIIDRVMSSGFGSRAYHDAANAAGAIPVATTSTPLPRSAAPGAARDTVDGDATESDDEFDDTERAMRERCLVLSPTYRLQVQQDQRGSVPVQLERVSVVLHGCARGDVILPREEAVAQRSLALVAGVDVREIVRRGDGADAVVSAENRRNICYLLTHLPRGTSALLVGGGAETTPLYREYMRDLIERHKRRRSSNREGASGVSDLGRLDGENAVGDASTALLSIGGLTDRANEAFFNPVERRRAVTARRRAYNARHRRSWASVSGVTTPRKQPAAPAVVEQPSAPQFLRSMHFTASAACLGRCWAVFLDGVEAEGVCATRSVSLTRGLGVTNTTTWLTSTTTARSSSIEPLSTSSQGSSQPQVPQPPAQTTPSSEHLAEAPPPEQQQQRKRKTQRPPHAHPPHTPVITADVLYNANTTLVPADDTAPLSGASADTNADEERGRSEGSVSDKEDEPFTRHSTANTRADAGSIDTTPYVDMTFREPRRFVPLEGHFSGHPVTITLNGLADAAAENGFGHGSGTHHLHSNNHSGAFTSGAFTSSRSASLGGGGGGGGGLGGARGTQEMSRDGTGLWHALPTLARRRFESPANPLFNFMYELERLLLREHHRRAAQEERMLQQMHSLHLLFQAALERNAPQTV